MEIFRHGVESVFWNKLLIFRFSLDAFSDSGIMKGIIHVLGGRAVFAVLPKD